MTVMTTAIERELEISAWQAVATDAGTVVSPADLASLALLWQSVTVPVTIATLLGAAAESSCYEQKDWWFRAEVEITPEVNVDRLCMEFGGLATLADIWLNGEKIAESSNMFLPVTLPPALMQPVLQPGKNVWHICFRSLERALGQKRPRPRWKTKLVEQQNLRWYRTSLLGRMPALPPMLPVVGPWRPVHLVEMPVLSLQNLQLQVGYHNGDGTISLCYAVKAMNVGVTAVQVFFAIEGRRYELPLVAGEETGHFAGEITLSVGRVDPWWPHTHGEPRCYAASLVIASADEQQEIVLAPIGFKTVEFDRTAGRTAFRVNGVEVFCRGACWTPADVIGFRADDARLRHVLTLARDGGLNMLRIGGTMVYEDDRFYRLCSELGIVVWQDFMFANMDYPVNDAAFANAVEHEARVQLQRLAMHACVGVYCGGSEVQQQAAMVGMPASDWSNTFFDNTLPQLIGEHHAGVPYFPSSPCEGVLPFQPGEGIVHYYGVGAYRRPLSDATLAQVKFASECLGFSNVPDSAMIESMFKGKQPTAHHPVWKTGVPRDAGSGYDFEDVRDFYLQNVFGEDPVALRAVDSDRYFALSRAVSAEVMANVFSQWRSATSTCRGGLIWFFQDLWAGAGWGIVDSLGQPKAAYFGVRRAAKNVVILLQDRGLDGLFVEIINETAQACHFQVIVHGFNAVDHTTFSITRDVSLQPREQTRYSLEQWLGYFADLTHSYKFGPVQHAWVRARLQDVATGRVVSEDFYQPGRRFLPVQKNPVVATALLKLADDERTRTPLHEKFGMVAHGGLNLLVEQQSDTVFHLRIRSSVFMQWVKLDFAGFTVDNNYFHVAPEGETCVVLTAKILAKPAIPKGYLEAVNLAEAIAIRF